MYVQVIQEANPTVTGILYILVWHAYSHAALPVGMCSVYDSCSRIEQLPEIRNHLILGSRCPQSIQQGVG